MMRFACEFESWYTPQIFLSIPTDHLETKST